MVLIADRNAGTVPVNCTNIVGFSLAVIGRHASEWLCSTDLCKQQYDKYAKARIYICLIETMHIWLMQYKGARSDELDKAVAMSTS